MILPGRPSEAGGRKGSQVPQHTDTDTDPAVELADDQLWPIRYSAEEMAALRWLLDQADPEREPVTPDLSEQEAAALGFLELEESGKIETHVADDRVVIRPPHDLILAAARQPAVQVTLRRATPSEATIFVFFISPLRADEEVGLELWLRADGATWVNTWPLDEMAVRIVEHLGLPPMTDPRAVTQVQPLTVHAVELESLIASPDEDGPSPLMGVLAGLETYASLDVTVISDEHIASDELRVLVTRSLVATVEAADDGDEHASEALVVAACPPVDVVRRLERMLGGA